MRIRLLLIVAVLAAAFLLYNFWPAPSPLPLPRDIRLALWMSVTWSMEAHSDAEIATLAAHLQEQRVDYAYVYVSYLRAGDVFNPTYEHAAAFTRRLRAAAPDITLFAWVGVPVSIRQPDGTMVENRLEDAALRQQIADFAAYTVTELGFDGFHLNAEMIASGDEAFLQTLAAVRETLPAGAPLSTTAHALRLQEAVTLVPYPQMDFHWTPAYLQQVAQHAGQVALMAYDSGLPFPRDYRAWVRYQTQAAAAAVAGTDTELLIGLPLSREWTPSHQTQAETLYDALGAFSEAFSEPVAGIALYPHWEMGPDEWRQINAIR